MTDHKPILLLTDQPGGPFAAHLKLLYPDRVTVADFTTTAHDAGTLAHYGHVVTMVTHRSRLAQLDYAAVREYAAAGGVVASCLAEYAASVALSVTKSVVPDGATEPGIRIRRESDLTCGFSLGDVTPWFGKVSGALMNINNANQYFQRQIMGLVETGDTSLLGVSTLNAGAVLIEERVGSGRIMALDLLSLREPFFDSWGSTNKYLFLGNLIGSSVHYGKHYPRKLTYDELLLHMQQIAQQSPRVTYTEEGTCSDGRPLASLSLGNPDKPGFLFTNGIHGWEWEAGYGLLHLVELLAADTPPEGLSPGDFHLKVVPQLNPFGYDHDFRQNANGVDLNRNFPYGWEQYAGGDDVYQPWDFDYKGPAPASEPETQIVMRLMEEVKPVVLLDFHTAHYILCKTGQGDQKLQDAIHEDIKARWKDRYLIQRPYSTEYQQANMDPVLTYGEAPHLVCYGAQVGIPGSILIEMSGNRTGTHGLVMNTDTAIEICLAGLHHGLRYAAKGSADF